MTYRKLRDLEEKLEALDNKLCILIHLLEKKEILSEVDSIALDS